MNRLLLSLCFLFAACGEVVPIEAIDDDGGVDNDGNGNDPDANIPDPCAGDEIALEDLQGCFLKMQCEQVVRCKPGFPDVASCEANLFDFFNTIAPADGQPDDRGANKLMFEIFEKAADPAIGGYTYNADKAYQCLVSVRDGSCKDDSKETACEHIITGDVAEGGLCYDSFECLEGSRCARDSEDSSECSVMGSCRLGVALGGDCVQNQNECQPGLDCVTKVGGGTYCQNGGPTSRCDGTSDCQADRYCSGNLCISDLASGSSGCTGDGQCPGDEVCLASVCSRISVANDPCDTECQGNLFCNASSVCQAMPGMGQSCLAVTTDPPVKCESVGLVCGVNDNCVPRLSQGTPCPGPASSACALGTFCDSEVNVTTPRCVLPRANSSLCQAPKHCASGHCKSGTSGNSCEAYVACWE